MNEVINLIFTIDSKYIQHFTVALTSILENNKELPFQVFVIHDLKYLTKLYKISVFFEKKYGLKLKFLSLQSEKVDNLKITHHISKATYFRILIADIIPAEVDKALFIDSDVIVTSTLNYFNTLTFDDETYLFAVNSVGTEDTFRLNKLGFAAKKYFNAGVMFLNLKAWRDKNVSLNLLEIANKYRDDLLWWDQDVLNMFFYNYWKEIPAIYNIITIDKKLDIIPVIIHFAGSAKPWDRTNAHPYRELYFKYLKLTPFKYYSPTLFSLKNKMKKLLK